MWRRILAEGSLIAFQSMALIALCATVGISRSDPQAASTSEPPLGLDLYRPEPADNPASSAKVRLGRRLFRDRLLSRDRSRSKLASWLPPTATSSLPPGLLT